MRYTLFISAYHLLIPVLCTTLLLPACASKDTADELQNSMSLTVSMNDIHRCSRISPEIQLINTPAGTEYYDVRLMEFTGEGQELFLGGGSWEYDGSGIIPEGVLTRHYLGPCPPSGKTGNYAFVVSAMNRKSMQPLAVRIYRFSQE